MVLFIFRTEKSSGSRWNGFSLLYLCLYSVTLLSPSVRPKPNPTVNKSKFLLIKGTVQDFVRFPARSIELLVVLLESTAGGHRVIGGAELVGVPIRWRHRIPEVAVGLLVLRNPLPGLRKMKVFERGWAPKVHSDRGGSPASFEPRICALRLSSWDQ